MKIQILYFAQLADELGTKTETFESNSNALSVAELKTELSSRGAIWSQKMAAQSTRCAVSQKIADDQTLIRDANEVAFFPPVTGG